jgi:hypothetical protein
VKRKRKQSAPTQGAKVSALAPFLQLGRFPGRIEKLDRLLRGLQFLAHHLPDLIDQKIKWIFRRLAHFFRVHSKNFALGFGLTHDLGLDLGRCIPLFRLRNELTTVGEHLLVLRDTAGPSVLLYLALGAKFVMVDGVERRIGCRQLMSVGPIVLLVFNSFATEHANTHFPSFNFFNHCSRQLPG